MGKHGLRKGEKTTEETDATGRHVGVSADESQSRGASDEGAAPKAEAQHRKG